jgi:hypothetical protein
LPTDWGTSLALPGVTQEHLGREAGDTFSAKGVRPDGQ